MNGLLAGWRYAVGAIVLSMAGVTAGEARAASADLEDASVAEVFAIHDGAVPVEGEDLDSDTLPLGQRYAPVPPRPRRYYRPYRSHWNVRIVPPPIFAPGWFGLYFLGNPPPPPPQPEARPVPVRRPDFRHVNEYSLGIMAGGYYGQYQYEGQEYTDPGLRFNLQYRNTPVVGAELSVGAFGSNMRPDGQGDGHRSDVPIQLSAMIHLFPRSPIQPYLLLGGTADVRTYDYRYDDGTFGDTYSELRVGPHVGLGVEFLVGDRVGLTVDARRVMYTLVDRQVKDQTYQKDGTVTAGVNLYF